MGRHHHNTRTRFRAKLIHSGIHILCHLRLLVWWLLLSAALGLFVGAVGAAFVYGIGYVTGLRQAHPWLILGLPLSGLLIVWLYRVTRDTHDRGTNMVLASIRAEAELPVQMAPLIFLSTILTHLSGGSAGREGAALQLGGSLGNLWGKLTRLGDRDRHVMILCGMAAAFSAIFGTPIAAAVFAMEVVCVGTMHYGALVPCAVSSLTASWLAGRLGLGLTKFQVLEIPAFGVVPALKILGLGVICAGVSILFCLALHRTEHHLCRLIQNPYLRILAASGVLLLLTALAGNQMFLGLGTETIAAALAGQTVWYAFLGKILFTAVTIAGGFKGGEIVPTFFIGATLGCLVGQIFGLSPSLCAAAGMAALFCGVTNCPLTSLILAAELFGMDGIGYYLLAIAVSYLLSGYYGLYGEQKFFGSKFTQGGVGHGVRE